MYVWQLNRAWGALLPHQTLTRLPREQHSLGPPVDGVRVGTFAEKKQGVCERRDVLCALCSVLQRYV